MGRRVAEKRTQEHSDREQVTAGELAKKDPVGKCHADPQHPEHRVGDMASCLRPGPGEHKRRRQRGDDNEKHGRRAVVERREREQRDRGDSRDPRRADPAEQAVQLPGRGRPEQRQARCQEYSTLKHQGDRYSGGGEGNRHPRAEIREPVRARAGTAPFPGIPSRVVEPKPSGRPAADPGPRGAVRRSFA
jgi:hypothetical protein